MGKRKDKKRRKQQKKKGPSLAERADRYRLYQKSVQEPSAEVEFMERAYREANGRMPKVLREDFCGTFAVSCAWAQKRGRSATAVDIDPEPLAWGRAHNLAELAPAAQKRVRVLQADVRTLDDRKADVIAAENFSYWTFQTRPALREYLEIARANLAPGGILVLDSMGGSEGFEEGEPEVRRFKGFRYQWELARYDPIANAGTYYIHFAFKDGSKLERAFAYHWRFWSIVEVRELLAEAGFTASIVYWETEDEDGEGSGEWEPAEEGTCDPSWIAYIVGRT